MTKCAPVSNETPSIAMARREAADRVGGLEHDDIGPERRSSTAATRPANPAPRTTTGGVGVIGSAQDRRAATRRGRRVDAACRTRCRRRARPADSSEKPVDDAAGAPQSSSALRSEYTQFTGLIIVPSSATSNPLVVGEEAQRRRVEQVPVAREVVAAPVAALRDREVEGPGVVGDDEDTAAGYQDPADGARAPRAGSARCSMVWISIAASNAGVGEVEVLDAALVHGDAAPAGGRDRAVVEVDAFERPSRRSELARGGRGGSRRRSRRRGCAASAGRSAERVGAGGAPRAGAAPSTRGRSDPR